RNGALPHYDYLVRGSGNAAGSVFVLSWPWRARANAGLGTDAAGWCRRVCAERTVDGNLSRPRDHARRDRFQPLRRRRAGRARSQDALAIARFGVIPTRRNRDRNPETKPALVPVPWAVPGITACDGVPALSRLGHLDRRLRLSIALAQLVPRLGAKTGKGFVR